MIAPSGPDGAVTDVVPHEVPHDAAYDWLSTADGAVDVAAVAVEVRDVPVAGPRVRPAWRTAAAVACAVVVLLLALAGRYGYNVDELYFRLLGERGWAWGYTDQPPLVPALVHATTQVLGDSVWAIRVPAALCAGAVVLLGTLIAAELGGSRRAQTLAALGLGSSFLVLSVGHIMVTTTLDLLAWSALLLCVVRALLRGQGRWWVWAGIVLGLALYAKYIVALLPVGLLVGLALVGPRKVFRDRWLYAGIALALVIGAPNLIYQATHDFPQLQMADALGATDGPMNRVIFVPSLVILFGPVPTVVWAAGLVRLLRDPAWRPVRALAPAFGVAVALTIYGGGRPDYVGGFLIALFAAGAVAVDRWLGQRRFRQVLLGGGLAASAALQLLMALPVLPQNSPFTPLNNISLESVGWPRLADQVRTAYLALPPEQRERAVVLADNLGESGALDRYGHGLPPVYSGHNELHKWGPPPEWADVVVAVGVERPRLAADFRSCTVVGHLDNGVGVENAEQGKPVTVCHGRRAPWARLWPAYHYLSG
ncbi:glycosyltransferase family 39 protein [Streptomyces sp. NPDC020883]|uniref:glycosyltransferase family 39 protein n=1 Tax=Streptomyces sp. NPDC020883 TaxID=3365099 RepID=UPI0037A85E90